MDGALLSIIFDDEDKLNEFDTLLEYLSLAMHEREGKESEDLREAIKKIQRPEASRATKEIIGYDWFWNFDPEYDQGEDEASGKPMIEIVFGVNMNSEELALLKKWLMSFGAINVSAEDAEFWGELEE